MKRIFGFLLLLLSLVGLAGVVLHAMEGDPPHPKGNAAYEQGQEIGKFAAPVVCVVLGVIGLGLILSDDARPAPPPRRNPVTGLRPGDHSLRGGQNTFASNPARLQLNAVRWLAANPWVPAVAAAMGFLGFIFLFIRVTAGVVLLLAAAIIVSRELKRAKQKFLMGDVCPGTVLSVQDNLVAVYTNLVTSGNVPRPAIKILKQPLRRITAEPAYDGMRVAAAALYYGDARLPAWKDFMPEVIHCVERDPDEITRVVGSIPEQEWQAFEAHLSQIAEARPGLYRMWQAAAAQGQAAISPGRAWFQTPMAKNLGVTFVIVFVLAGLGPLLRAVVSRHRAPRPLGYTIPSSLPQPASPANPGPGNSLYAGPGSTYTVGESVEAFWPGKWTPGKIVSINPGGFSMMVQVDDARFPQPIVLSTNQIRPK